MSKQKSISIIGCGWLGLPLAALLVEKGYKVRGSTTSKDKLPLLREKGIIPFLLKAPVEKGDQSELFQSDILYLNIPPGRRRSNVLTVYPKEIKSIVELAVANGTQHIIFVSSTGVYPDSNKMITETHPLAAERDSGKALIAIEAYLEHLTKVKITILRMAGLVGGNRKAGRFLAGKKDVKNGEAPINLVHLEDCLGVSYEVIRQQKWGEVYNVCTDEHPTRAMFYTYQAFKENLEPPTFVKSHATNYKIISNEKVKEDLNYKFQYPDPMEF